MNILTLPSKHRKFWYLLHAPGTGAKMNALKYIAKRFIREIGMNISLNDELLIKAGDLNIYFAPACSEIDPYNDVFLKKSYEPAPDFLPENNRIIIDCGANIGIYTLRAALCKTTRVFSIEPNPAVFMRLMKNVTTNGLSNIVPLNIGLGSTPKKTKLRWGNSTLSGRIMPDGSELGNAADVELTTLDLLAEQYNITYVDIMKMDIEGAEYDALTGAAGILDRTRRLFLEIHSTDLGRKCESLLIGKGFRKVFENTTLRFYVNTSSVFQAT